MSLEPDNTKFFNVVGSGFVSENHADDKHRNLLGSEKKAIGGAIAWLTFYLIAVGAIVVTNFDKVSDAVVAAIK